MRSGETRGAMDEAKIELAKSVGLMAIQAILALWAFIGLVVALIFVPALLMGPWGLLIGLLGWLALLKPLNTLIGRT
jgi:uncharacterized membrane protein